MATPHFPLAFGVLASALVGCASTPQPKIEYGYCEPPPPEGGRFTEDPAPPKGAARTAYLAALLGLSSALSEREAGPLSVDTRLRVLERIEVARIEISATTAELDCESERLIQAADYLSRSQSSAVRTLTVASVLTAAGTAVAGVFLGDGKRYWSRSGPRDRRGERRDRGPRDCRALREPDLVGRAFPESAHGRVAWPVASDDVPRRRLGVPQSPRIFPTLKTCRSVGRSSNGGGALARSRTIRAPWIAFWMRVVPTTRKGFAGRARCSIRSKAEVSLANQDLEVLAARLLDP